jgi:hypothetical protein
MKLTPARKKFLAFMSGPYGRALRAVMGISLLVLAFMGRGWYLLLLAPAAFMIWSAVANYCPANLLFPSAKQENLIAKMPSYKLKS